MSPSVKEAVPETLLSGYITQGPKVTEFEKALEAEFGFPFLTTNSCTSAITLALRLSNVGLGDEVITTPMTCQATNVPILSFGAIRIWADIDSLTGLISPEDVESKITPKTKAIICVDWGGAPSPLYELRKIADAHAIPLIEDAAHALGSTYKLVQVGSIADFTCFSFQAIKHLTTGDGGALSCRNPADFERAKLLRWFGIDRDSSLKDFRGELDVIEWGYKFHMNDINATIGLTNLPEVVEKVLPAYIHNSEYLLSNLDQRFWSSFPTYKHKSASWIHTILVPPDRRERFRLWCLDHDLQTSQVHWRNDRLTAFDQFQSPNNLPGVDYFSDHMICLPCNWSVDPEQVANIVNGFKF